MTPKPGIQLTDFDERMMRRALEVAERGVGQVSPGPLVGTVIVDERGEIAGEGCYIFEQLKHAETIALEKAADRSRGGTAYVSLEPHAHYGRTPPCTDALIKAGLKRVVAPIEDPNPKVSGRGFAHLQEAGVEVTVGLLRREAEKVNEAYIHFMRTGRPFVHLKLAVSLDGKIATKSGDSRWIAGAESRSRAHDLRQRYDAIMVGSETAVIDDPLLTDRSGKPRRRDLLRIVLDDRLRLTTPAQLVKTAGESPVLLFTSSAAGSSAELEAAGVEVIRYANGSRDLEGLLHELGAREIQSLLLEGGGGIAGAFLDAGLVNKVTFFVAPMIIGGQNARASVAGEGPDRIAEAYQLDEVEITQRGRDVEVTGYPKRS